MFKGMLIQKNSNGYQSTIEHLDESQLPDGDVTLQVRYSSINYKDALAITGRAPIVRQFPMIPGIDLVGEIIASRHSQYKVGETMLLNGWGVGEKHWGGLAEKARLDSRWLIPLPRGLDEQQVMAIGTAGYTAMLAVIALERHGITPKGGPILVTGANGGVGSFATAILSRLGYQVIAATRRSIETDYLLNTLGATEILAQQTLASVAKPLQKERWIAAIDSLGSHTLANICAATAYGGCVAACGLAQGMDFNSSVAPFILRGVTLTGIDSVMRPYQDRVEAWQRLAELMDPQLLNALTQEISLDQVIPMAESLLAGQVRGRIVVNLAR